MERQIITPAERGARRERIIKSRVVRILPDDEAEIFLKSQAAQPIVRGEQPVQKNELSVRQTKRIIGDKVVDALGVYSFNSVALQERFLGWLSDDGTLDTRDLSKGAVAKQEVASPATVGEQAADTATQAADRERIRRQYELERRLEELQRRLDDIWQSGGGLERERRLLEQIDATNLELSSMRDAGTRVLRVASGELLLVKVDERIPDAFAFRGGQSFTVDAAAGIRTDLVKGVDDESLGIRKDEALQKAIDEIDLSNPFGIQRRELYK